MAENKVKVATGGQNARIAVRHQTTSSNEEASKKRKLSPFFWNVSRGDKVATAGRNVDVAVKAYTRATKK